MKLIRFPLFLFLIVLIFPVLAQGVITLPENFDVQGHRGARGLKPENTLPSFETALDLGVTTLELDLHFTVDETIVIWHDDKIESDKCELDSGRMIDAPNPDSLIYQGDRLRISQLTWEQLQAYRCDRNPDVRRFAEQNNSPTPLAGDDYHILSLDELFAFVKAYAESEIKSEEQRQNAAHILFNIETKRKPNDPKAIGDEFDGRNPGAFERAILDLIEEYELEDRVIIQSFDHRSLWAVHRANETIILAALTSRNIPDFVDLVNRGAIIWSPNYQDLTPEHIQQAHQQGMKVIPWTVNEIGVMAQLIEDGVDGIITDYPDILLGSDQ